MKYVTLFLTCYAALSAEIIETKSIFDMNEYADVGTLLVYDIDNTLLEPLQALGSDQWFSHRFSEYLEECSKDEALINTLSEFIAIQAVTSIQEVEKGASKMVDQQQKKGCILMGLTTRDLCLAISTLKQLAHLEIDFSKNGVSKEDLFFQGGNGVLFRKGVLFTSGTDKGRAFQRLLESTKLSPKRVVFINDKKAHLLEVESTCKEMNIPFIGLRYGFLDEKVQSFNKEIAKVQLSRFGTLLSDTDAHQLIK